MNFYINWSKDWNKAQQERIADQEAFDVAKNTMSDAEIETLGSQILNFQSMNPNEQSDLPYAAASMGLTGSQYYDLWKETETVIPNSNEDPNKKRHFGFWNRVKDGYQKTKEIQAETQKDLFPSLGALRKSTVLNGLLVGLNAKFQDFQVGFMNSYGVASKTELEKLAAEQGKDLDRDFSRFVGDPETEDNEIPISWKVQSFVKGLQALATREVLKKGLRNLNIDVSEQALNLVPLAITDSLAFRSTQKDFKFSQTDIETINKYFPSVYAENLKIKQDGEVREPTNTERIEAYIDTLNTVLGSANPNGI